VRDFGVEPHYFSSPWNECYDMIEFCVSYAPENMSKALVRMSNRVLEEHISGYRLINGQIAPITSEDEISSIESAIGNSALNAGARAHFRSALEKLSDRAAPDHRNSIKESISAVEAVCQQITGAPSATLGQALKPLEDKGLIHPALKSALSKLYGYTSDSGGIRHAMLEETSITFVDSKFMLVACTAFVNYLIDKSRLAAAS
ncbi:AbiJ-NTD4 domain-containing protein, partial [Aerolutibacter daejeonensis]|uniref:AbiJ-NTD4 domain-containing protein n=1 Tax=Aerolutibacter daejeonensis TaxID=346181 RepID=UPI0018DDC05A